MEPWWQIPKKAEAKRQHSTDEIDYKMVLLVLRNVIDKYGGVGFWQKMIDKYGKEFFENRSSTTLKQIWKRIKRNYDGNLVFYKNLLETRFDEETIKKIKKTIKGPPKADALPKLATSDKPKKCKWFIREMNLRFGDQNEINEPPMKMKPEECKGTMITKIDIQKLLPQARILNTTVSDSEIDSAKALQTKQNLELLASKVAIIRDFENKLTHCFILPLKTGTSEADIKKKLLEFSQKSNRSLPEIEHIFKRVSRSLIDLEKYLKGEKVHLWTDYEDHTLAHPEDAEMYRKLEAIIPSDEIKRRKAFLNIK